MINVKYLVTGALPYVNNELHLGQFVGCLLPPDVFTRFLKLKKETCAFISGTDEYGTPIAVAAQKEGLTPKQLADKYHELQKKTVEGFNIRPDIFSRTTAPEHVKVVQDFYYKLKQNNYIYRKEIEQLYCEKCKRFLPDRYVEGRCPHCGKEARGDQCDACGNPLEPTQLIDAYCVTCKTKPTLKKSEHVFFNLPQVEEKLVEWIEGNEGLFPNAKSFATSFLKQGLHEKDISRNMEWGVPIPDADGLVFYVWFDAPLGYITFTKQLGKENWWKDKNTKLVHFLGKDNIVFHTIYFPGMLIANGDYILPSRVASYEFLTFGGSKLSKSKGVLIKAKDALDAYPADYWRFALISLLPENKDTDFTWEIFREIINNDLNDTIGNFVHRTLTFAQKFYSGRVEQPKLTAADKKVLKRVEAVTDESSKLLYDVQLKKALAEIVSLARDGNQYITLEEPWKNEKRRQNVVYVSLSIAKALATLLEPFVPEASSTLKTYLGVKTSSWDDAKAFEKEFNIANDFKPLFRKIEGKEVKEMTEKFNAAKKETPKTEKTQGGKPMIKYDDFDKIELKIAVIKAAERVEKSDKLIKLTVDAGDGNERTIVAGLAEHYKPEEMVGKKIVLLANLEPRKMKGIESNGMLLAAEKDGIVSLLTVDKDVGAGAQIR